LRSAFPSIESEAITVGPASYAADAPATTSLGSADAAADAGTGADADTGADTDAGTDTDAEADPDALIEADPEAELTGAASPEPDGEHPTIPIAAAATATLGETMLSSCQRYRATSMIQPQAAHC